MAFFHIYIGIVRTLFVVYPRSFPAFAATLISLIVVEALSAISVPQPADSSDAFAEGPAHGAHRLVRD
jgi:hypothetical protein